MTLAADTTRGELRYRSLYWTAFLLMALPLPVDLWRGLGRHDEAAHQQMNVDLGVWALRFFLLSFAVGPAATLLREPKLKRYRRMLSLFAFAYAMAHSVDYILYAHAWVFPLRIWERRLYLMVGIAASLMMVPLAVTSAYGLRRRMGPKAWRNLHVSVYVIALLVVLHTLWEQLTNLAEALVYCTAILVLLISRVPPVMGALQSLRDARVSGNSRRLAS